MANDENKNNTNIWTINLSSPLEMSARILGKYSRYQLREIVNCIRVELEFYLYRPIWYPNAKALEDKNGNPASLSCHFTYTKKDSTPKKINFDPRHAQKIHWVRFKLAKAGVSPILWISSKYYDKNAWVDCCNYILLDLKNLKVKVNCMSFNISCDICQPNQCTYYVCCVKWSTNLVLSRYH